MVVECPICLEVMDETDLSLLPCPCDYQVCLWCLQRIRAVENNKCPQCRREYDDQSYRRRQHTDIPKTTQALSNARRSESAPPLTLMHHACLFSMSPLIR